MAGKVGFFAGQSLPGQGDDVRAITTIIAASSHHEGITLMKLLLVWLFNAVALLLVPYIVPGVHIDTLYSALIAVVILGLVNTVIRPIFILLTLPVTLLTLGLFLFVVNALMFWFAGDILSGFRVDGFFAALFGSIVYSLASWLFSYLMQDRKGPR